MRGKASRQDRFRLVGIFIGMAIAAVVAFVYAYESDTIVRYLIMASGLLIGWGAGSWLGRPKSST